jgi:hypothetical protein
MRVRKAFTPVPGEGSAEAAVARALNRSWPVLDAYASAELARAMVSAGNVGGYLNSMPWEQFIRSMGQVIPPLELMGGRAMAASIGDLAPLSAGISFSNIDSVAVRHAERQAGRLIAAITESQRQAIAEVMARSLSGEYTVTQAAARIRDSIGLHPAWARAVGTYRDRQITRLIVDEGKTAAAAIKTADRLALTYRNRLIRSRSLTIARTEIQTAQNVGRFAGWAQQIGNGVAGLTSQKEWTAGPGACKLCQQVSGQRVQWDRPFSNRLMMPPAHPNCRCNAVLIPAGRTVPRYNWLNPTIDASNGIDLSILDGIATPDY